uniref:Proline dehydrogenase n=1 Tax=Tanacetum cinerariifolium TaxID=118510 RepID=A0A699J4H6_TANCI|nr:proline dehydrogenase 2, mitochondrial-like [Tanacetum cinerariifolium]
MVVKVTAVCPVYLLRRVSDLLRWEYKNSSFMLLWKQQTLPIFSKNSPFYHTLQQPTPLTAEEEQDLELAHKRLMSICEKSFESNVPVVIDDAGDKMALTKKAADKMGLPLGFKFVRGDYMSSERKLARSLGVESPIHDTIDDAHIFYNGCARYMLNQVSSGPGGIILATHNLDSG